MEKPFGGSFKYREPLNEAFMITSKDFQFADKHTTALTCSQCFTMFECNILVEIDAPGWRNIGWKKKPIHKIEIKMCPYCGTLA